MAYNFLKSSHFPYLKISIKVLHRDIKIEALVDTGFDGDIAIPPELVLNGDPPAGYVRWTLASGQTILAPYFMGTIKVGNFRLISIQITVLGDEPIIGRGIIDRFKITLDHGQKVILED